MTTSALPVLWLYGPAGVGKTTAAWELFTRISGDGVRVAHVDIDQLGMCYGPPTSTESLWPEPVSDHVRHRRKTVNLDAVAANAREAGAAGLIVSGIVDPEHGIDTGLLPNVALTAIRLRAEPTEILHRLSVRARPGQQFDEVLHDAAALDRNDFPGACIDTTRLDVDQVLEQVTKHAADWLTVGAQSATPLPAEPATTRPGVPILWLCGPRPPGLSAVGYEVHRQLRLAGMSAAYLDLEQVGFLRPPSPEDPANHRFKAANLAAVYRTFQACGADCLVAVGSAEEPGDEDTYVEGLADVPLVTCRTSLDPNGRPVAGVAREILVSLTGSVPRL